MPYRSYIDFLTQAELDARNASSYNRPVSQLNGNVEYLRQQLAALTGTESLVTDRPCSTTVLIGTPVGWNSVMARMEPAQAGIRPALGICVAKPSDTTCSIRMTGYQALDLTNPTGSASPAAGLYYLSQTTAGTLEATRPASGVQQPVLYSDGQGGVYMLQGEYLPLPGPQGIQGIPGTAGTAGLQGETGPTGPAALPSLASGRWYTGPINYSPVGATYSFPANKLIAVPFSAPGGTVLSELALKVMAAGNPGDEARLGIYSSTGQYPSGLLTAANGVLNGASAGPKVVSINSTAVAAGQLVWLVMLLNSSQVGILSRPREAAWAFRGWGDGLLDPTLGYMVDYSYGALPSTFPNDAAEITDIVPTIFAKVA